MERRAGRRASNLLHAGGPLVALVVLGSLGLSHLIQGRKDVQDARRSADDVRLPAAVRMRKGRLDLEAEAERLKAADTYVNKPVPKPSPPAS